MPLVAPPPPPGLPIFAGLAGIAGFGGSGGGTPRDADIVAAEAESSLAMLTSDREDKSPLSSPS